MWEFWGDFCGNSCAILGDFCVFLWEFQGIFVGIFLGNFVEILRGFWGYLV